MTDRENVTLNNWLPSESPAPDLTNHLTELQRTALDFVTRHNAHLDSEFHRRAIEYSLVRESFLSRLSDDPSSVERLPFKVFNEDLIHDLYRRGNGIILVSSHCGFWTAAPFWLARKKFKYTFVFEALPDVLDTLYGVDGAQGIHATPGFRIGFDDGTAIRIPGSGPLISAKEALSAGLVVGFFGDTFRQKGVATKLLNVNVDLIQHYALLSFRLGTPLVYLSQWTTDSDIVLSFKSMNSTCKSTNRTAMIRDRVETYAKKLNADLLVRPEQYAYGEESIFAHAAQTNSK